MKTQTRLVLTAVGMALAAGSAQAVSTNPLAPYLDAGYAIAPDKFSKSLVVFKASAASDASSKTPTAWSFTAADAGSAFKALMEDSSNAPMKNPDEAKLRDGGRTLLLTGSWWSGWAEIDVVTKQARRYAKTGTSGTDTWNTHSIDKLPDGTLVIANSTPPDNATGGAVNYCNGLVLITTDANGNHTYKKAFSLYGAHGVEWDPVRNCLWAIGNTYENNVKGQATLYKLAYDPSAKTLTELAAIEVRAKSDGTDTGHGLRLGADGKLYCSAADAYVVDPDTNPATVTKLNISHTHDIKGVAADATYGLVSQESGYISGATDVFLNDHVSVIPVSGSSYDVYPAGGTRMYKVSWASALPATFVPYIASGDSFWCGGDGSLADANFVNDDRTTAKAALKAGNRLVFGGYESPDVTVGAATTAAGIVAAHGTTTISGAVLTLTGAIETGDADAVVIVKGPVAGAITKTGKGTLVLEGANDDVTALNVQAGTVAVSNALPSGVTANVSPGATFIDGSAQPVDPDPPADPDPGDDPDPQPIVPAYEHYTPVDDPMVAETKAWIGTPGGNWYDAANWNPSGAPDSPDAVTYPMAGTTEIVVNKDSSAELPAAATMVLGSNTKAANVKLSGGHTLYLKAGTGVSYKVTEQANSIVEVAGAGTKAYFMTPTDATNIKSYFVRFNGGGLKVTGGAYAEIAACQFSTFQAIGQDASGVRSKIRYGWAQNSNYSGATTIANGGDIEFQTDYQSVTVKNCEPTIIARNGGTNDMAKIAWGSGNNPRISAEDGGVVLLPNLYLWSSSNLVLAMTNGMIRLAAGFSYNSNTSGNLATMSFAGDAPQLYVTGSDNGNSCSCVLGKVGSFAVKITVQPTLAWADMTEGLVWNAGKSYVGLAQKAITLTIDVSKLDGMRKGMLRFPLIGTNPSSQNGVTVSKTDNVEDPIEITIVGKNAECFTATSGLRSGDKRHYDVVLKKIKTGLGMAVIVR